MLPILVAASCLSAAPPTATIHLPSALVTVTPESEVVVRCGAVGFLPLAGLGPVFEVDGHRHGPRDYAARVTGQRVVGRRVVTGFRADFGSVSLGYRVTVWPEDGSLRVRVQSGSPFGRGVTAGRVLCSGAWQRYDLTRTQEAYGQDWWTQTNYLVDEDAFFSAEWMLEGSRASGVDTPDPADRGRGPFSAAPNLTYAPLTDGTIPAIDETLVLRVGRSLADAMPRPRQKPSEYKAEMAHMVYLDLWGGSARDLSHTLALMEAVTSGRRPLLTILQPWEAGGWDALLPDSIRMPDYGPDPKVGSVEELQGLAELGTRLGRFGFRTNYMVLRENSPSYVEGRARFALGPDGTPKWHTSPADWALLASRQEREIHELWEPTASFTDQLTSGASPAAWLDFAAAHRPTAGTLGDVLERMRGMANAIKAVHHGPLGSESLMDQYLLGEFVDFGDFGIMDGYHRVTCPEYHLRVMRDFTTFFGMGLHYRFVENAPYPEFHRGRCRFWTDRAQQDDYRCMEVLYGNGGYLAYDGGTPWTYALTELLLVANLQDYYAGARASAVEYLDGGRWQSLEELIRAGYTYPISPFGPQPDAFRRVRVRYDSGLVVVTNRSDEPLAIDAGGLALVLPRSGWAAWMPDGTVRAFSALHPDTGQRVDAIHDARRQFRYIDPRGVFTEGVSIPTAWRAGRVAVELDEQAHTLRVRGRALPLRIASPPLESIDFGFETGPDGWLPGEGILTFGAQNGLLHLRAITPDPQLLSPELRIPGDSVRALVVRLRATAGEMGQLYFATSDDPAMSEERMFPLSIMPGREFVECRVPVGESRAWRGHTITRLRLDPVHGPDSADVEIDGIWTERE